MFKRKLVIANQTLDYVIKTHQRAKRLSLSVYSDNRLVVVVPPGYARSKQVEQFVKDRAEWIAKQQRKLAQQQPLIKNTRTNYLKYKEQARSLIQDRLQSFNQLYKFKIGRVAVRNQQTRWGSCSHNLNFNYRLIFLPTALIDYIIVHELCHLQELNHSQKFWHLVEQTIPDYKLRRRQLKQFNL